jgi:hypothetical protein
MRFTGSFTGGFAGRAVDVDNDDAGDVVRGPRPWLGRKVGGGLTGVGHGEQDPGDGVQRG